MRIALLISGGGSTMEAIIRACLPAGGLADLVEPVLVIASNPGALGIEKAKKLGIKTEDILVINPKDFKSREEFGRKIIEECKKRRVDFVGQYGWMVLTPENIINEFEGRIVNQHPGPLDTHPNGGSVEQAGRPDFGGIGMYGMRVHQARLEFVRRANRDFWTEATAHRVTSKFDDGAIVKNKRIEIKEGDTAETLRERVLPVEHEIQIELLKDFALGKVLEFHRETPLVLPGEEKTLEECKENAIKKYPKG